MLGGISGVYKGNQKISMIKIEIVKLPGHQAPPPPMINGAHNGGVRKSSVKFEFLAMPYLSVSSVELEYKQSKLPNFDDWCTLSLAFESKRQAERQPTNFFP